MSKFRWLEWLSNGNHVYRMGEYVGIPADKIIDMSCTSSRGQLPTATISLESGKRIELFNVTAIGYGVEMERDAD